MPPTRLGLISGYLPFCRQLSDLYSIVCYLCALRNSVGHNITGVQNTMLLSRTMVLLTFKGAFAAAEDINPESRLLVSLTTGMSPFELVELCSVNAALVFLDFCAIF